MHCNNSETSDHLSCIGQLLGGCGIGYFPFWKSLGVSKHSGGVFNAVCKFGKDERRQGSLEACNNCNDFVHLD